MHTNADFGSLHSNCGQQVCSHPMCWKETRNISRKFRKMELQSMKSRPCEESHHSSSGDKVDGIPTMSILNVLDEYGNYDNTVELQSVTSHFGKRFGLQENTMNIPPEGSQIVTKLNLHALTQESGNGITPAPANTPLQSSHGFGDTSPVSAGLPQGICTSTENASTSSPCSYNMLNMNLYHHTQAKRFYVWCSRKKRSLHRLPDQLDRMERNKTITAKSFLPFETIPNHSNDLSWQAIRGKKSLKNIHLNHGLLRKPIDTSPIDVKVEEDLQHTEKQTDHKHSALNKTPYEIEQLRHVPLDVLMRVVKMALCNEVLSTKQATILLQQVTGRQYPLPSIERSLGKNTEDKLLKTGNIKIYHQSTSPSKACPKKTSVSSMYKLDQRTVLPEVKRVSKQRNNCTPSSKLLVSIDKLVLKANDEDHIKVTTKEQNEIPIKSKALMSNIPITCVVPSSAADVFQSTPPRPFHYLRTSRDLSLRPLPTPPPPSPSTERDSQYDEILGGSTVLVNASNTPTLTSNDRPASASTQTAWMNRNVDSKPVDELYVGSSSECTTYTKWPQVNENDFICESRFTEANSLLSSKIKTDGVVLEDSNVPVLRELTNSEVVVVDGEVHSPAPPPPSPELPVFETRHSKVSVDVNSSDDVGIESDGMVNTSSSCANEQFVRNGEACQIEIPIQDGQNPHSDIIQQDDLCNASL